MRQHCALHLTVSFDCCPDLGACYTQLSGPLTSYMKDKLSILSLLLVYLCVCVCDSNKMTPNDKLLTHRLVLFQLTFEKLLEAHGHKTDSRLDSVQTKRLWSTRFQRACFHPIPLLKAKGYTQNRRRSRNSQSIEQCSPLWPERFPPLCKTASWAGSVLYSNHIIQEKVTQNNCQNGEKFED